MLRWPRGKYNGQRIVGFEAKLILDLRPQWRPLVSWNFGNPYLIWLFFNLRAQAVYARKRSVPTGERK